MTRDEFIAGIQKRAKELREAGVLGKRSAPLSPGKKRGRPPKPVEPDKNDPNLIDAFDEIEEPIESDISK